MTLKAYLISMISATLVCWLSWILILFVFTPDAGNVLGLVLFYISLFLALTGTGAVLGFVVRFVALKKQLAFRLVRDAFRQSFLFATLIIASLFLLSRNLFGWMNLGLLIASLSMLEYFMISYKQNS